MTRPSATVLLICLLWATAGRAFVCMQTASGRCVHWASARATLRSILGQPDHALDNGTLTYDENAVNAAADWNAVGANFSFAVVTGTDMIDDPCTCPDETFAAGNPVFFVDRACGQRFGDILAETALCFDGDSGELISAPVFVNGTVSWSAYDGPERIRGADDIRRALLHEFGHVLGLGHPDTAGQVVEAIMNSQISDTHRLQPDDVAGILSIYGQQTCAGDCDADGDVTVDELIEMVGIALGQLDSKRCSAGDEDGDGTISVDEVLRAVNHVLNGCEA